VEIEPEAPLRQLKSHVNLRASERYKILSNEFESSELPAGLEIFVEWVKPTHNQGDTRCFRLTGGDGHARLTTGSW